MAESSGGDGAEPKRVLVVEDEYFIADEVAELLERHGITVLGPVPTLEDALSLVDRSSPHAAILDINLRGQLVFPLADELRRRNIPFVFATGYGQSFIPDAYGTVPRFEKPFSYRALIDALPMLGNSRLSA